MHGPNGTAVVITGASSGIGRCTALALAKAGANLVLIARREKQLLDVIAQIRSSGRQAEPLVGDVTLPITMQSAIARCVERFGRLDILINNAGEGFFATCSETTVDDVDRMLAINFKGMFHGVKAALPVMMRQGRGHIINVASMAGRRGSPYVGAYCASKFAVVGFTESLRAECLGTGITVSLICPGATTTDFFSAAQRRTEQHTGLVGPTETPEQVADQIVAVVGNPRPDVTAQPFRRSLFLIANLLMPGFIDRLLVRIITGHWPPRTNQKDRERSAVSPTYPN
jgi:short-subunit dehydrogenase